MARALTPKLRTIGVWICDAEESKCGDYQRELEDYEGEHCPEDWSPPPSKTESEAHYVRDSYAIDIGIYLPALQLVAHENWLWQASTGSYKLVERWWCETDRFHFEVPDQHDQKWM